MNAARSMPRMRVRMPTAARLFATASPIVMNGGNGVSSPASNPFP